ncbi:hypothetical protein BBP40_006047 [Aspergillus hancockii]|nr:hypothetical protein BBP40_006047 [Aspergillus hancockii]
MKVQQCLFHGNPRVWYRQSTIVLRSNTHPRSTSTATPPYRYQPLQTLKSANIEQFREKHFSPERPAILPRGHFRNLPVFDRWFQFPQSESNASRLNTAYLDQHGAEALVPLELTQPSSEPGEDEIRFRQFHAPLGLFLQWMRTAEEQPQPTRLYLAQCQLLDLPQVLRDDFPAPELVSQTGKGDVYDTNVWIGYPPTYTPLHRDPNPNLFVQLAGRKTVRLLDPGDGQALFALVRRQIGKSGNREAAAIRGEDMMQGRERTLLEEAVWTDKPDTASSGHNGIGYEAHLEAGDGMFIPKGWWHSIKGVGEGVTASCLSNLSFYQGKTYSTMLSSTELTQQQQQPQSEDTEKKPQQYLALPDANSADQTHKLDVSGDGSTVKLDHMGPLVVNQDGSLSRISNWEQMTDIEKKNTLRVLGKRNKMRMEALKAAGAGQENAQ